MVAAVLAATVGLALAGNCGAEQHLDGFYTTRRSQRSRPLLFESMKLFTWIKAPELLISCSPLFTY